MGYLDNNGLSYLWSKLKATFVRMRTATATLSTTGWTLSGSYYTQSVTASGVTTGNNIIVEASEYVEAYSQTTNSVAFRSTYKPTNAITVKIFIFT